MDTNVVGMVQRCVLLNEYWSLTHIVYMLSESSRAHQSFRFLEVPKRLIHVTMVCSKPMASPIA